MIDDLVMKVISVEDIPANVASELVTLFNMVVKRTPQIFPVSVKNNIDIQKGNNPNLRFNIIYIFIDHLMSHV